MEFLSLSLCWLAGALDCEPGVVFVDSRYVALSVYNMWIKRVDRNQLFGGWMARHGAKGSCIEEELKLRRGARVRAIGTKGRVQGNNYFG